MTPDKIKKKVKRGIIAHRWLDFPRFWLNEEFLRLLITPEVSLIWSFVQMLKKMSMPQFLNHGSLIGNKPVYISCISRMKLPVMESLGKDAVQLCWSFL